MPAFLANPASTSSITLSRARACSSSAPAALRSRSSSVAARVGSTQVATTRRVQCAVHGSAEEGSARSSTFEPEVVLESKVDTKAGAQSLLESALEARTELAALMIVAMLPVQEAMAKGGEFGIYEKKASALIHPIIMLGLFGVTAYAGYLGWQWRSIRTIGDEISVLKKQLPPKDEEGNQPHHAELEGKIATLTEQRKTLTKGNFKERHYDMGNLLLSMGVTISVLGGLNTYMRVGKLFPGPHLYAGVGITVLWALAAAMIPYMQKGNTVARNAHIALNCANLGLFAWQIPTGIEILLKVNKFVAW